MPLSESGGAVQLEISALKQVALLRPHTANLTPHSAAVAALANQSGRERFGSGRIRLMPECAA